MKRLGKINFLRLISALISTIFLIQPFLLEAASMTDYCIIPPYVKTDVTPNILIVMDNSQIMGNAAYDPSSAISYVANYDPTKTYTGYFRHDLWYKYEGGQFVPASTGVFKGNMMNWVTTSRYDLLQSILVGGKSRSRQTNVNTLTGISNSWTKSYGNCVFEVDSGNLTIKDKSLTELCTLIDIIPTRIEASIEPSEKFASESIPGERNTHGFLTRFIANASAIAVSFLDFLVPEAEAAKPLRIITNSLPDAPQNTEYSATLTAEGGTPFSPPSNPYSWSLQAGSVLPAGLSLSASGVISGSTTAAVGNYDFTVVVTDSVGGIVTRTLRIKVVPGGRAKNYNIWICAGNYTTNCTGSTSCSSDSDCPTNTYCENSTCVLKSGIVDIFWSQARYGFIDFSQSMTPNSPNSGSSCIPASPKSSFLTNIENATPVGDSSTYTQLVNGAYAAVDYYKNETGATCDPYRNVESCVKSFVLMITAGEGADNPPNPNAGTANVFTDATNCTATSNPPASYNLAKNTCYGYKNDLRQPATPNGTQNVSTYVVNAMGTTNGAILSQAAVAGGGNYYDVVDPTTLRDKLIEVFSDIIKRAAAGTAASVLASGEGSGANLVQAVFYPRRKFYNSATQVFDEVAWTGRLTNFWYYIDPFFTTSSILDDSGTNPSDRILNLSNDKVVKLRYDPTNETTTADRYAYGSDTKINSVAFEYVKSLWEAGLLMWDRTVNPSNPSDGNNRTIKTTTGSGLIDFSVANKGTLDVYLQAGSEAEAESIIRYIHGEDTLPGGNFATNPVSGFTPTYRSRKTAVDINGDNDSNDTVTIFEKDISESAKVWKLGDVLNSTPKISSWIAINTYDQVYGDTTYESYINSTSYQNRGMVFTGANDGMLHAFKLGKLELLSGENTKAQLTNPSGYLGGSSVPIGQEMWAFIPKHALPYLKYLTSTSYGACHVYTVDLTPYIFDASINGSPDGEKTADSWRTILIGGMRFGGGCRKPSDTCANCVKTPILDPDNNANGLGYSSYFALDITNQDSPTLLWEFSDEGLGLATTGPAVVRINAAGDTSGLNKNGHWYVVFGSGPTGPIDTTYQQFLGRSAQPLKFFVVGPLTATTGLPTVTTSTPDTAISNAFAGSMFDSSNDVDLDYAADVIYVPYVKQASDGTWTSGGVGRLQTKESTTISDWKWSVVMDEVGPLPSAVKRLIDTKKGNLWLYFGTGRYYYERAAEVDDANSLRKLYGVKENSACLTKIKNNQICGSSELASASSDATNNASLDPANVTDGWYITLDCSSGVPGCSAPSGFMAERMVTDPLASVSGYVLYSTFKPYSDMCALGGKSYIWAVKYDSGGAPGALLKGIVLLQVSTGSIEQMDLEKDITDKGGRRIEEESAKEGLAGGGMAEISAPPPVKRSLHTRER